MNEISSHNIVITFGTFDLLHIGHIRILQRAKRLGTKLIVGVSSDELNMQKKHKYPVYSQQERMEIISALECVDQVFLEESLELKKQYIQNTNANILVMGDDWKGAFDDMADQVIYFERTPNISTTNIVKLIKSV